MALPEFLKHEVGTTKTWAGSGGDYAMTFASITANNGRQGVKGDLGANRARRYNLTIKASVGAAATAGNEIEVYWAPSSSATAGTDNPGGLSGTDATFNTTPDEYKQQLLYVGSLVLSNNAATAVQVQKLVFEPQQRYGMPVIVNKSGQTLHATEGNFSIVVEPIEEAIEDAV